MYTELNGIPYTIGLNEATPYNLERLRFMNLKKDNSRLFHDQIILDGFDSFDTHYDFIRFIDSFFRINEAAQLDRALERLDTDLK